MKLSVACLASGLPASSALAAPGLTPSAPGVVPRKFPALRVVRLDLDDDDIPTTLHRPERPQTWAGY